MGLLSYVLYHILLWQLKFDFYSQQKINKLIQDKVHQSVHRQIIQINHLKINQRYKINQD
jgi:hypothetical protein